MSTKKRIYLDHAATTDVRPEVLNAITDIYKNHFGNPSGFYEEGQEAAKILTEARATVAKAINAKPEEIYFTSCGSESDNWALKGTAYRLKNKGKHIITTKIEHHAVLHTCQYLEDQGFELTYLDVDEYGIVQPESLKAALREDTILVSIMMANNEIGSLQPIKELAAICKEKNIRFHSDAVQALGAIPIDVEDLEVDMLSFSAHKLYGPKGIGALYLKKGTRLDSLIHGGGQEMRQRAGTENLALIAGFAKACELAVAEMPEESKRQIELRDYLIKEIKARIPHAKLNGHPEKRLPNNANYSFEFIEGESMLLMLDAKGYACSTGSACASSSLNPSHVLLSIGLPHEIAHGSLRMTIGKDTSKEDLDRFLEDLPQVITTLRNMSPLWGDYQNGRIKKALID